MSIYKSVSDKELTELLNRQDKQALEEVYLRYWERLFNHAVRLLKEEAAAEDLVQELFTHLFINIGSYQIITALDSYLYRAVRNRVLHEFNKSKHRQKYVASLTEFINQGVFATDELVLEREMKKRIDQAVAEFPPKMREVFELSRKGNLSRREIAQATSVSEETVKTQMTRALKILRTKLTSLLFFYY